MRQTGRINPLDLLVAEIGSMQLSMGGMIGELARLKVEVGNILLNGNEPPPEKQKKLKNKRQTGLFFCKYTGCDENRKSGKFAGYGWVTSLNTHIRKCHATP